MPEGDTIHKTAAMLRRALVGRALRRVELPRLVPPLPAVGATVERAEARGKHLLVHSGDGRIVHTHQRITGTWHLYRPGARWRRPPHSARVVLAVPGAVAVSFSAPGRRGARRGRLASPPGSAAARVDLCQPDPDRDEVVRRLDRLVDGGRPIGEALLDQRVSSGIGNVYRCDVLFLHGLDPATPVAQVDDVARRALFETAHELLQANLDGVARTTVPGAPSGGLWVYGRAGAPCRRCGTPIVRSRLGEPARVVDRCPRCQPSQAGLAPRAHDGTWSEPGPSRAPDRLTSDRTGV